MNIKYLFHHRDASGAAQRSSFKPSVRSQTAGGAGAHRPGDIKGVCDLFLFMEHSHVCKRVHNHTFTSTFVSYVKAHFLHVHPRHKSIIQKESTKYKLK